MRFLLAFLLLLISQVEAGELTYRTWSLILSAPYMYKGQLQEDVPQIFTRFHTRRECEEFRDARLLAPRAKVIRDCWDPELPGRDEFMRKP